MKTDKRTSGEISRKEGGKIFGGGSRAPIAITVLVKNPNAKVQGQIYFHDIGDYRSREDKLDIIRKFGSIQNIIKQDAWQTIVPDDHHDWLNLVNPDFDRFLVLGDKKDKAAIWMFENYSCGVKTQRDAWCYNASKNILEHNIRSMIAVYHAERVRYHQDPDHTTLDVNTFINSDPTKISWTRALKKDLVKNKALAFTEGEALISTYRPFSKQWMYYGRRLNEMVYQMPHIFPNAKVENLVICVTGIGARSEFSALMVDAIPNLHTLDSGQCFPLKLYEKIEVGRDDDLFVGQGNTKYQVSDGISNEVLVHFQTAYPGESICKEDLFYYLYGVLHSEDYRTKYQNNLMKQLPRLPIGTDVADFRAFQTAGCTLAELHLDYESVDPWPVTINDGKGLPEEVVPERFYRVEKMKFGGGHGAKKRSVHDHLQPLHHNY